MILIFAFFGSIFIKNSWTIGISPSNSNQPCVPFWRGVGPLSNFEPTSSRLPASASSTTWSTWTRRPRPTRRPSSGGGSPWSTSPATEGRSTTSSTSSETPRGGSERWVYFKRWLWWTSVLGAAIYEWANWSTWSIKLQGDTGGRAPWLGWLRYGEFPRLFGCYCSYLLPKQDGGTSQI